MNVYFIIVMHACSDSSLHSGIGFLGAGLNMANTVLYLFIVTAICVLGLYLFFKVYIKIHNYKHIVWLSVLQSCVFREPCTLVAYTSLVVMLPLFLAAVYIFRIGVTDKSVSLSSHYLLSVLFSLMYQQLTPSQSRDMNKACLLDSFYDYHDLWHFLSAIAMFLSFLVTTLLY